jgi:hypothetical protein
MRIRAGNGISECSIGVKAYVKRGNRGIHFREFKAALHGPIACARLEISKRGKLGS